ncbi:uncharacterized protein LOC127254147 [Andrographis paniculata]|uniref:uncharacterized protein LOC127254147 n=1 Tax=Andrographis paniculata TaxID=175694 RepID=UPI0021E7B349|nr:uncharacterized protein LOC127254147 [Andrographis paniculata]
MGIKVFGGFGKELVGRAVFLRWMAAKAPNRAAVHGLKLPAPDIVPREKVERVEIQSAMEEKGRKRKEIEDSVDSHLNNWRSQLLYVEEFLCVVPGTCRIMLQSEKMIKKISV